MTKIQQVTCEFLPEPLSVTTQKPRFAWAIASDEANVFQTAYQIKVWSPDDLVWNSGMVNSSETVAISYDGEALQSATSYRYQIRVWLSNSEIVESDFYGFETGFYQLADWKAKWIEPKNPLPQLEHNPLIDAQEAIAKSYEAMMRGEEVEIIEEGELLRSLPLYPYDPAVEFRKVFHVEKSELVKARLYVTSHGVYDVWLNGQPISDSLLNPGFTTYDKRLKYQAYKVDDFLKDQGNVLHVTVADGWYKGKIALGRGCDYGEIPGLLLQLELTLADGSKVLVATDETWTYSFDGSVRMADLFGGETVDGRLVDAVVHLPDFDDSKWENVVAVSEADETLDAQSAPLVTVFEEVPAKKVWTASNGDTLVDFGQNMAGLLTVTVRNEEAGEEIAFAHFEELGQDGNYFYAFADGNISQTDTYICAGTAEEIFKPRFTYHGFRYVKVTGGHDWTADQFVARAISSDNPLTGHLVTSDSKLNQLQSNILWSQRTNNIGIPTDCPTREKAGWTGDVYAYGATALFNQNMVAFYEDWLKSIRLEQKDNGIILGTVPQIKSYVQQSETGSLGWGDVIFSLPLQLYKLYGDKQVLEENFEAMQKWMDAMEAAAYEEPTPFNTYVNKYQPQENLSPRSKDNQHYLINTGFHFGDWIIPSVVNEQGFSDGPASAYLTMNYVGTSLVAYDAELFAEICTLLGKNDLAAKYTAYAKRVKEAYNEELVENDRLGQEMQGNYVLALKHGLVTGERELAFAERLNELIVENGYRLDTGFMATPHLLDVLCDYGYQETAWRVLWQEQNPSWFYQINHGATTMWENWDAIREDGSRHDCSFNHYAFGCVGDFLYRRLLGIQNDGHAYDKVVFAPDFSSPLTSMSGQFDSVRGPISFSWEKVGQKVQVTYRLPSNTKGELRLPDGRAYPLTNGQEETVTFSI
ncbi:TPA: family 78 glycoside hydrolase catalytic domain [Streptococcus suis]|nr:family 78 glycoside hydrolase catalytic domain [Streptococcus suis]HEM5310007.1 family 78 glycoside hydrolase catalytic domain [Streptococcus suis]HEM5326159.1 family 78 glycoside hydrolase catalytic domain [Streptococcus suis]HEM5489757.1 family 78 glycoside hydrolase catalytic domain [Streptococcus suis]